MNKIVLITILINSFFTSFAFARVDLTQTKKLNLPTTQAAEIISKDFMDKVLPKSADSNQRILSKMADDTLAYWWQTTPLRNTSFGRAAETIEKNARLQGKILDSNKTTHTFDFKVLVMQALARFEYKGWVNAGINYDARASESIAELTQPIADDKDLVVSQKFNQAETTSRLSFNYNW